MRLPLLIAAAVLALPASAMAAPPPNDNYLASTTIAGEEYTDSVDTTEATTQPDMFNPNRDGLPFGGGDPEPTSCGGASPFGKTVWWDFRPPSAGGVEIKANGGFDVVVAVYKWSASTSKITSTVRCQNDEAGSEDLIIPRVSAGTNYTIQVGGANNAGGPVRLEFTYFPDTDGDGILDDAPDKCRKQPGIERFGGCPPELKVVPSIGFDGTAGGITIKRLIVDKVPKGAKVVAKCAGCGSQTVKATRFGRISLNKLVNKNVRAGTNIEIRVTLAKTGKGTYVYGATGSYFAWPVRAGGLGARVAKCLNVKSSKIERCR